MRSEHNKFMCRRCYNAYSKALEINGSYTPSLDYTAANIAVTAKSISGQEEELK